MRLVATCCLASLLSTGCLLSVGISVPAQDRKELRPPSSFATVADPAARSRALFTEAAKVIMNPRCVNCHPAGDGPLQGDHQRPHFPPGPWRKDDERWRLLKSLDLSDPDNTPESYGSGIVINHKGLVLTNYHVVQDATKVYVRLPGGNGSYADIYAADPRSDENSIMTEQD